MWGKLENENKVGRQAYKEFWGPKLESYQKGKEVDYDDEPCMNYGRTETGFAQN